MIDIPKSVDDAIVREIERIEDEIQVRRMELCGLMALLTELKKFHADYEED